MVMQERDKLISASTSSRLIAPGVNHNIDSLNALVGKEARRLEKDLKNQLRFYEAVEKGNLNQLYREKAASTLAQAREEKRKQTIRLRKIKSEETRHFREAKQRLHTQITSRLEGDFRERQAAFAAHLEEEEARLDAYRNSLCALTREKSEKWKRKLQRMKDHALAMFQAHEDLCGNILGRFDARIQLFQRRKSEEIKLKMLKHEESTLRLIEAKDKRLILNRLDEQRKSQIAATLDTELARVESLIATRDEIIKQRKLIIREQESVQGRPLNIKDITPGPADYYNATSSINENPAPKISGVRPKLLIPGSTDFELRRSREVPPLGAYNPKVTCKGHHTWEGVKFSLGMSKRKTYLDDLREQKAFLPGPGSYKDARLVGMRATIGPRFVREYFSNDKQKLQSDVPGPGAYTIDRFTRQEQSAKSRHSILALARALRISVPVGARSITPT